MRASELHRLARILREIALDATGNTGSERVNAGELAVLEDIAHHPSSTIRDITSRTGLAQSLVSRIVRWAEERGAVSVEVDTADRRRVRVELSPATRLDILERARGETAISLAAHTPLLTDEERAQLELHLKEAARLLGYGVNR